MTMTKSVSPLIGSWAGTFPALGYGLAIVLGAAFGIRSPARWIANVLMWSAWTGPVFVLLLFGGLAVAILNGLLAEESTTAEAKGYRDAGWFAFTLLLITVPLLMFQVVFVIADLD